jgi:eukaryotic-like serine/threonine-protein kinase
MQPDADRIARLYALFDAALDLPRAEHDAYARAACGDDSALHEELCRLLAHERAIAGRDTRSVFGSLEAVLRDAMPDAVHAGSQLGEFSILEEIGAGGMGRVFRAERSERGFTQRVAIKLLRQELTNPDLLRRFSAERQILAGLSHPGICRLIDAGALANGTPYVVMELVEGEPLFEHCDRRLLSLEHRLQIFRQVLAAVSHAHQNLVVHRDIKSSNILVEAGGTAKLLDFGIAKVLAGAHAGDGTATADRYLSFSNAAPEQLLGARVTVACDVYALGAVMYQLCCGLAPFDLQGAGAAQLETQILHVPPAPMSRRIAEASERIALNRGLGNLAALRRASSGDLERIVQKCLRKAPEERYASVEQLDDDVANFLACRPIRASAGQRWYRLRKFIDRNRLPVALGALLLVAVATIAGVLAARNLAALRERDRAQQALSILRNAFLSADPSRVSGEAVTVRAVLDAARPALEESFDAQPELYASLASSISEVELAIGLSTQSAELFDRAADAARRGRLDPGEHFHLLVMRARALYAAGEYERAQGSLHEASALGVELTPEWEVTKAIVLLRSAEYQQAIVLLRHAIESMHTRPPEDEWANSARLWLANALRSNGDNAEALRILEETVDWHHTALDPQHPRIALTRIQIAVQKRLLGRPEESLSDARQVHADVVAAYGPRSPFVAKAAMVLGNALITLEHASEAEAVYREAISIYQEILGDTHPDTLRTLFNLAEVIVADPARRAEARDLYRKVFGAAQTRFGMKSNATILFRNSYARTLLADGEAAAALSLLVSAGAQVGLDVADDSNRSNHIALLRQAFEAVECAVIASAPNPERPDIQAAPCAAAAVMLARIDAES